MPRMPSVELWLIIVGSTLIGLGVLLWNIGEGWAAAAISLFSLLFGGLAVLAGLVVLAIRRTRH